MTLEEKEIYKPTTDDWYPNFENNTIQISLLPLNDGTFRVCAWGNDDFGMELDFESLGEAEYIFDTIEKYSIVNKQDLYDLGFEVS